MRCAMFRQRLISGFGGGPKEGETVRIPRQSWTLYENRGDSRLLSQHLEPAGAGALQQAFEALKLKLSTRLV